MTRLRLFIPWALCIVLALGLAWTLLSTARFAGRGDRISLDSYTRYVRNLERLQELYRQAELETEPSGRRQLVQEAGGLIATIDQQADDLRALRSVLAPSEGAGEWHLPFHPVHVAGTGLLDQVANNEEIRTDQLQEIQALLIAYRHRLPVLGDPLLFEQLSLVWIRR